jgi:adenylylsulfate kinase-like enzyme
MILSDLSYWTVRSIYTSKVRNNKLKLFQEQFQELYHFIDKRVEHSIRRDFFRSALYQRYSNKEIKKFPWNYIQVIER